MTIDIHDALAEAIVADRRPPDGLLHPSGDLIGSLRHTMLTAAGAPTLERSVADSAPLIIGTLMHQFFERMLRGAPVMAEVNLTPWMLPMWTGTADAFVWDDEARGFVLHDWKTSSPESWTHLRKDGAKKEHIWQTSAYWWAAVTAGFPMVKTIAVLYFPKGRPRRGTAEPMLIEFAPLPWEVIEPVMTERSVLVKQYLDAVHLTGEWVNAALAPVQDRVQTLRKEKDGHRDVVLEPHFTTAYCSFPDELCDCRHQGETKIGYWYQDDDGTHIYVPRKGYEHIDPEVTP